MIVYKTIRKDKEKENNTTKKKDKNFFWIPQQRLKMQKDIGDDVHIGQFVMPFQCVGKSKAVNKTASDFDNANFKVKEIRRLIEHRIYDADIAHYILGTLDLVFQGMIEKIKTIEHPADL